MKNLGSFLTLVEQKCYLCLGRINSIRNEQIYVKGNLSVYSKSFKLAKILYLYSLNSFVLVGLLFGVESSSSKGCSNWSNSGPANKKQYLIQFFFCFIFPFIICSFHCLCLLFWLNSGFTLTDAKPPMSYLDWKWP